MVGTTLKMRVDENAIERQNAMQGKKLLAATTNETTTKRSALGELQNRGVLRAVQGTKDALQKDTKDLKFQNNLRNAKSRVDSHWKKPIGTNNNNANTNAAATAKTTTTTAAGTKTKSVTTLNYGAVGVEAAQRRVLIRSNSVRLGGNNGGSTIAAAGLSRHVSANVLPIGKVTTTVTNVKVVDSKLAIEKPKGNNKKLSNDGKTVGETATTLRREDSNLSRKSLTKLRAALSAKPAAARASNNNKPQATAIDAAAAKKVNSAATATKAAVSTTTTAAMPIPKVVSVQNLEQAKAQSIHSNKRLEGVEDIDADDKDNLVLVAEYVNDIYDYLYSVEAAQIIRKDHLEGQTEVHSKMRAVLIDWINEVHVQFHLAGETFHMAVAIIDLYLQAVKDTQRLHLQLVGVTALFIATKYEELFPPAIADFVYITDDTYTSRQIRLMELEILKALDFNLSRPLPIHFLRRYSKAAGAEDAHHAMSKYFLELASIEYDLASYKPSEIAAASLFLSLHLLNGNAKAGTGFNNKHWNKTLQYYSCYTPEHLRPISKKIAAVARNAPQAKLKSVYTKYQTRKFQEIATRSELYGPLMDSIVNSKE